MFYRRALEFSLFSLRLTSTRPPQREWNYRMLARRANMCSDEKWVRDNTEPPGEC